MTKRIAIAALEGAALDWAVAMAVCPESFRDSRRHDGTPNWVAGWLDNGSPSTDWSQCGPLKARYNIDTIYLPDGSVRCRYPKKIGGFPCFDEELGQDELTATCRAIVAAHNPDGFVEVPDEVSDDVTL